MTNTPLKRRDVLSREVSIDAELTASGVSIKAKSRFLTAIDRLCGGVVDIFGAKAEGKANRIRIENEIKEDLISAAGKYSIRHFEENPEFGKRIADNFTHELIQKQLNRDSIAEKALHELIFIGSSSNDSNPESNDNSYNEEIDADWLNQFYEQSGLASSEMLQIVYSKILAGEINNPGTFSKKTVRHIAEIDQKSAQLFEKYCKYANYENTFIIKPKNLQNIELIEFLSLEEDGFIAESNGNINFETTVQPDGFYYIINGKFLLIFKINNTEKFTLGISNLTRFGKDIKSLTTTENDDLYLREIAKDINEIADSIKIATIVSHNEDGGVTYKEIEVIK